MLKYFIQLHSTKPIPDGELISGIPSDSQSLRLRSSLRATIVPKPWKTQSTNNPKKRGKLFKMSLTILYKPLR